MRANLAVQLDSLPRMGKDPLCALWRQLFQTAPPQQLRRQLMVRILAYSIQERAFRALSPGASQRLRQWHGRWRRIPARRSPLRPASSRALASSASGEATPTS